MVIRKLEQSDAIYLHELMTSKKIANLLFKDYSNLSMDEIKNVIKRISKSVDTKYYSIANDENEYMGTTALKRINKTAGLCELIIAVRNIAMGKGYALFGLLETLDIAFNDLGLDKVYWCVSAHNKRALHFFMKHGFGRLDEDIPKEILKGHENEKNLLWFAILKGDDYHNYTLSKTKVGGAKIIKIKTIPTIEAGELSFFEANNDIPFEIKRIYYISKVPEGMRRGFHAHKKLKQLLYCPYGKIQLILENKEVREEVTLSDPSIGLLIEQPTWREMLWLQKDSVLCVAASEYYDVDDYIRNYDDFKKYISK